MTLNPADVRFAARLDGTLPPDIFRPVEPRYLEEPRGLYAGRAGLLALPRTVEDVAALIRAAAESRVPVVPYGGGTGLVGGQVMPNGPAPLILSLERMSAIRAVHADEYVLVAEAGAVLTDVQSSARKADRLFPLSLASEGSARIGGLLGTNAGGVNVLRYGNARDLCLGLEAVLPDGRIWRGLSRLRKDNTGYDLRDLLIGAEGTLGVITAAALKLFSVPARTGTAMIAASTPEAALRLLAMARDMVGEGISAFELMSAQGFDFLAEKLPGIRRPLDPAPDWTVLIELGLSGGPAPSDVLEHLYSAAAAEGLATDGIIAQSEAQRAAFWSAREHMPAANRMVGAVSSHDISLPLGAIPDFIRNAGAAIAETGSCRINCFGHLGDGNLHYNVFPPPGEDRSAHRQISDRIRRTIHDLVHDMGGSISAEHGIGRLKAGDLVRYGDPVKLDAMRAIKSALDPAGIMNPGAVFPAD